MEDKDIKREESAGNVEGANGMGAQESRNEEKTYIGTKLDSLQDRMNSMEVAKRKRIVVWTVVGVSLFIIAKLVLGLLSLKWNERESAAPASAVTAVTDSTDILIEELLNDEQVLNDPAVDSALNQFIKVNENPQKLTD